MLTLWQWAVAFRFPLHRRGATGSYAPGVSMLKPLKGIDSETSECLESWLTQRYTGASEILFGVASASDPVCELVRELIARHPKANAQLVLCPENFGANAKVSTLIQLQRLARHNLIMVSDADVWVPEDFVAEVVAPFNNSDLGLVSCFYQFVTRTCVRCNVLSQLATRWENFAVNADFWSQVLQSQSLKPIDFALGAVMITRRGQLEKIGGFDALADYLADDYQLGFQISRGGTRLALSPMVVECRNVPMRWSEVWSHQLRWARTIRVCQPLPYFFSQLQNGTLWPCLWALWEPTGSVCTMTAACLLARMAVGCYCEQKLTRRRNLNALWLALFKDLLQVVIWALAFFGKHIDWRGQRFEVRAGGKLVKIGA